MSPAIVSRDPRAVGEACGPVSARGRQRWRPAGTCGAPGRVGGGRANPAPAACPEEPGFSLPSPVWPVRRARALKTSWCPDPAQPSPMPGGAVYQACAWTCPADRLLRRSRRRPAFPPSAPSSRRLRRPWFWARRMRPLRHGACAACVAASAWPSPSLCRGGGDFFRLARLQAAAVGQAHPRWPRAQAPLPRCGLRHGLLFRR
jgi:hypothetical protein